MNVTTAALATSVARPGWIVLGQAVTVIPVPPTGTLVVTGRKVGTTAVTTGRKQGSA